MMDGQGTSALFERAVEEFSKLPGVGRRTATRLVLHVLRLDTGCVDAFTDSVSALRHGVRYCRVCHNVSDGEVCPICSSASRDTQTVCVVESVGDVLAMERTGQFRGLYHVLGGLISPMDGVGPGQLEIDSLAERVSGGGVREVILALSSTMEGDATGFYIYRKIGKIPGVAVTTLSKGMSVNDELQYTDEMTLGRSLADRVPYDSGSPRTPRSSPSGRGE